MPYIKTVRAKGRTYEYFDTGSDVSGKRVLRRLPSRSDKAFGGAYAALLAARTRRENLVPVPTVSGLSREYQQSRKFRKLASNTQDTYLVYLRHVEDQLGLAPVNDVERRDIQELIDKMQDRPGAAAMTLLVLRNMFDLAERKEWTAHKPTVNIELPDPDEDGDHQPWPDDLLAEALQDDGVGFPVALLYYTGQRIGDVCKMRWADIEDEAIHVIQQKTGKELYVPIHAELAKWLAIMPRTHATMLYGPKGRPMKVPTLRGQIKKWAKDRDHDIVPHGLRKNAVLALLEFGCTLLETSAITGQSLKVVEHYAKRMNAKRIARGAMSKWDGTERDNRKPLENG